MKIKMLITTPGSVDGVTKDYIAGDEYDFFTKSELDLANLLVKIKHANIIDISSSHPQNVTIAMTHKKRRTKQS